MKRNVLTVFLASPGDLELERHIAREVLERINKVISRRVDWHSELLGWEETLPGYSRPQDIIKKDGDCCDLFLGLLWKGWGQATGKYTSGFHEEFLRAHERQLSSILSSPQTLPEISQKHGCNGSQERVECGFPEQANGKACPQRHLALYYVGKYKWGKYSGLD